MTKKNSRLGIWVTVGFAVATLFNQCGGVRFAEGNNRSDGYSLSQNGNNLYQTTVPLTGTGVKPLDIMWVVDNSGSMKEEAAAVKANLTKFVNSLDLADAQIALLNDPAQKYSVTLPATNVPSLSIDMTVSSTNALSLLAAALCPLDSTAATPCGDAAIRSLASRYSKLGGKLAKFLRPDSRKILVLVTDDNSSLAVTKFKAIYDSLYPADSLVVYGWVGLGVAQSPCQWAEGKAYVELASLTGGRMNNICDADWSDKFAELENNVTTLAFDTIPLPQDVIHGRIIAVRLNDRALSEADYKMTENGIVLSSAVRAGVTLAQVVVEFQAAP